MITSHLNPAYGCTSPITPPTGILTTSQAIKAIIQACKDNDHDTVSHLETRRDVCNTIVKIGCHKWQQIKNRYLHDISGGKNV
jgi:hypothetical protein